MAFHYTIGLGENKKTKISRDPLSIKYAQVSYIKGYWYIKSLASDKVMKVNGVIVDGQIRLNKNDVIQVDDSIFHWSNYIYEGESQELELLDLIRNNGRVSRSNYRALFILYVGLAIMIFFFTRGY